MESRFDNMRKLRDIVYIHTNEDEKSALYYGIGFKEFIAALPSRLNNLLLLKHEYSRSSMSSNCFLDYVNCEQIKHLAEQDIYMYGDFCWVDFQHESDLDLLEPTEIAELLFLGHVHRPLVSPFFEKLNNRFAYCAHDDAWRCRLYCRDLSEFAQVIANILISAVSTSKRQIIYPIPDEIKHKLLKLSKDGLLIDFHNVMKVERRIIIPIYTIGEHNDMDDMYNNVNRYIGSANKKAWLVHTKKSWYLES